MTISEVSEKYGMTQDTLRYYERVGLIPQVPRKPSGVRDYDESSCGWVEFIRCMRNAGLPIETLIEYVHLCQEGPKTNEARKHLLIEERQRLVERIAAMQATLVRLNCKIEHYESMNNVADKLEKSASLVS
ncbi:MerR family transcriptional regulator [Pectinatus frisingensis]|uniref:MerR family transcriptional regulator n=1 Tax=Pectinatus frisingensis TaxID=865 RepID=UPI0018C76C0A|nr:MerR family transcriptional regulator [Pectinatus frisingensis]